MDAPLWTPSADRRARANLTRFGGGQPYSELYAWSLAQPREFWRAMWEFGGIRGTMGDTVAADLDRLPGARFFPDATLNFADNCLHASRTEDDAPAIISTTESGPTRSLSWRALRTEAAACAAALRAAGIRRGDRIAAYLPNVPQAIVAVLGAAAVG